MKALILRKYFVSCMWIKCLTSMLLLLACGLSVALPTKRIVVTEGIGGALSTNLLAPAIIKLDAMHNNETQVVFYGTDVNFEALPESGKKTIQALQQHGMIFIDKSNPKDLVIYKDIQPDYVFISTPPDTHIPLAKQWVSRTNPPKAIMVEKPFTENLIEMEDFVHYLRKHPELKDKIYAFDFAETIFKLEDNRLKQVSSYLEGVRGITLFWLQNNSGEIINDPKLLAHDDRPISRENRVALLQSGMVFDELVHLFPAVHNIVDIKSAKITEIKAAQYDNAEIRGETFVAARFLMQSKLNQQEIPVTVYAGKGIGKIESLKLHRNKMHLMLLHGTNGKTVMLNMEGLKGYYLNENGASVKEFELPNKYVPVINNLFLQQAEMGQSVEEGLVNIRLAANIKTIIIEHTKTHKFATYTVGSAKSPAPSVESILNNTPMLYGNGQDQLLIQYGI